MSDDGSITVAQELREAAQWPEVSSKTIDLRKIIGVNAEITSPTMGGTIDAALNLARLIDPVTRPTADGSCERCGAGPEALVDQYCAHCGRRILRDAKEEEAKNAVEKIREAQHAPLAARDALTGVATWKGFSMLINDVVMMLTDTEEIMRRNSDEGGAE